MPTEAQYPEPDSALLEVGHVTKPHGLNGEVVVVLTTDREQRVSVGSVLQTEQGPLTVRSSRRHQDRWIVRFEDVDNRDDADLVRGVRLFAEPIEEDGTFWVHELVGLAVVTPDGTHRGVVESVIDAPGSDLLSLDNGALVPVVFVTSEPGDSPIVVDTPGGLFELFDNGPE